jgi:hypothetical protein
LLLAAVAGICTLAVDAAHAAASGPGLGSIVLSQVGPGFVAVPAGPLNGPITAATYASVGAAGLLEEKYMTGVEGYVRAFRDPPVGGVVIFVYRFSATENLSAFLAGFAHRASEEGTPATVPNIPGSTGVTLTSSLPSGRIATIYEAIFGRGLIACMVTAASAGSANPYWMGVSVSQREAGLMSGPFDEPVAPQPSTAENFRGGEDAAVITAVCGAIVAVIVLARRRRSNVHFVPPPLPPGASTGWYPDVRNPAIYYFWNGSQWTARGGHSPNGWLQWMIQ